MTGCKYRGLMIDGEIFVVIILNLIRNGPPHPTVHAAD